MKTNPRASHRHSGRGGHADRPSFHRKRGARRTAEEKAELREKYEREQNAALERLRIAMNAST